MPRSFDAQFAEAVQSAVSRTDVHAAVKSVYGDLDRAIAERRPLCATSGRCCRFDEFGHRLYITTLEAATFLHDRQLLQHDSVNPQPDSPASNPLPQFKSGDPASKSCPYQINNLCSLHSIRPFGCRIFFCDATATQWQQDQYEHFHAHLKREHQRLAVPYFYVEWRAALKALETISQPACRGRLARGFRSRDAFGTSCEMNS